MNVLFVRAFASHLPPGTALTVNAVNPGMCASSLLREANFLIVALTRILARTTEVGSRMLVHAAVASALDGTTGEYLNACKVDEPSDFVISEKGESASRRLWNETIAVLSEEDEQAVEKVKRYLG